MTTFSKIKKTCSRYWTCPQNDECVFQEVMKLQLDQYCFICLPAKKDNTIISAGSLRVKQKVKQKQQEYLHQMIWPAS